MSLAEIIGVVCHVDTDSCSNLTVNVLSAGTVMFQQARRLGEISSRAGQYRELATLQCQSYLAAANALSLVSKESAWIAVLPTDDGVVRVSR